jgi:hypothetical protein
MLYNSVITEDHVDVLRGFTNRTSLMMILWESKRVVILNKNILCRNMVVFNKLY